MLLKRYLTIVPTPDPKTHRKLCQRWDIIHDAHFLTFSCYQQRQFFKSDRTCRWFLEALDAGRTRNPFDLWAYVIMPEHVHLVLLPHEGTQISRILQSVKLSVTRRAVNWIKKNGRSLKQMEYLRPDGQVCLRFWQRGGGYDRNLRSVGDVHEKISYIHNNPVRRSLVERPEDWRWSSFAAVQNETNSLIKIDRESILTLQT